MCIFCQIAAGESPAEKIYEDENCFAFLDITPNNPGHCLLIPKKHFENLFDIEEKELSFLMGVLKKVSLAVKQGVKAEGINIGINNGVVAGQVVLHLHIHIIPRYVNDGLISWHGREYKEGEMKMTAEKIRKAL